jgi:transglutaminase-like putative cysteine protease
MISLIRRIFFTRAFAIWLLLVTAIITVTIELTTALTLDKIAFSLLSTALISTLLGWLLAATPLPGLVSLPLGICLGWAWAYISGGHLTAALFNWLSKFPPLLWGHVYAWLWEETPPTHQPLTIAGQMLSADSQAVGQRLAAWAMGIWQKQPAPDAVSLAIFWLGVLWMVAFWAGWATRRMHNPLMSIGPAVGLLAALLNYQSLEAIPLITPIGATLLLMALIRYDRREQGWTRRRIDFAEGMSVDLMLAAGVLVAGLLAAGIVAPNFSIRAVMDFAQRFNQPASGDEAGVGESLGLQAKPPDSYGETRPTKLSTTHILGEHPNLNSDVIMTVKVIQPRYIPPPVYLPATNNDLGAPHYYWRMLTYDQYIGSGWRSSPANTTDYAAETALFAETPAYQQTIRQRISPVEELGGVLFVTGQLQSANQPYEAEWRQISDNFTQADLFAAQIADGVYEASSYLPAVSVAQLRAAPAEYPAEISQRYLQLPESLPLRVRELALSLTADQPTPYDKAAAIEQYLRTFPYSLEIVAPPRGRDVVDYFLFNLQTGFCDYYASAMVVLARAAGLPARPVLGYASGSFDSINERYVVHENDSHAWVEVYFSGIGWVEFEPTAAQPAIVRPNDDGEPVTLPALQLPKPESQSASGLVAWLKSVVPMALLSLACLGALVVQGTFAWRAVEGWWWSRQPPEQAIFLIYGRMHKNGKHLLGASPTGDTPHEFASRLQTWLHTIGQSLRPASILHRLSPAGEEITQLTRYYAQMAYSNRPLTREMQRDALQTWRKLRQRLWLASWVQRVRQWRQRARGTLKQGKHHELD